MKGFKEIKEEYGLLGYLRLLVYPITGIITNPFYIFLTLFNGLKTLNLSKQYTHFNYRTSFNIYFYFARALNIKWYGKGGSTPFLGLGNYELARCFYYTKFALFPFWKNSAFVVFAGILIWQFSFFIFHFAGINLIWLSIVIGASFISSVFYTNLMQQNYTVVGWMFFPLFLFGIDTSNYVLITFSLLMIGFGSFSIAILSGFFFPILCYQFGWVSFLLYTPLILKIGIQALPMLKSDNSKGLIENISKAIGVTKRKAKYVRKNTYKLNVHVIYYLLIYVQFPFAFYLLTHSIPLWFLIAFGVFVMNKLFMRFMDDQNLRLIVATCAIYSVLHFHNWILLIPLWIVINPLPALAGLDIFKGKLDTLKVLKPISTKSIEEKCESFLSVVNKNEQGYFAWADPSNQYEKVFDGYRTTFEILLYAATKKKIILRPDWWTVFELNYEGAADFWGREPEQVKSKLNEWNLDFVIVYQENNKVLDSKWIENGFECLSQLNWDFMKEEMKIYEKGDFSKLNWFLLKLNTKQYNS